MPHVVPWYWNVLRLLLHKGLETTLEHMGMSSLFDVVTNARKGWFKNNTKLRLNNIYMPTNGLSQCSITLFAQIIGL